MECTTVNSNGQITIPIEIMKKMGLNFGDKVFFSNKNGSLVIKPASHDPLTAMQDIMEGVADRVGWQNEDDVEAYIKEHRKNKRNKNASNA